MDLHLADKVAIVTGGSRGLGRSIALALGAEGAKVALAYRQEAEKAEAVADEIRRLPGAAALAVRADLASEAEVVALFDRTEETLGPPDVLVNNAAYCPVSPVTEISEAEWNYTFQVNVTGTFLASREAARRWIAAGRPGRIVNISSQAAFRGSRSGKSAYDASKGALVALTVTMARELAPRGIAVNAVAPGLMYTEMLAPFIDAEPEKFKARIPLGRIGRTEEVASVVVFLASDRASFMTGATVDVSGGMLMR
jgi:3-oxoacyl-[acyl-carrier protein] reductase